MHPDVPLSRRALLLVGGAAAGMLALPAPAAAAPPPIDPYIGAVPLRFPLADGSFATPVQHNWHAVREGAVSPWNHRDSAALRALDGIEVYPQANDRLPTVYAPLAGTIAAVCTRSDNTVHAQVRYQVSATTPPPWDYHDAVDDVAQLPLYGNFVWLRSSEPASAGYFVFCSFLQREATLLALQPDQVVSRHTPLGVMGDTGNAVGAPQLHVEIHYPRGVTYVCGECSPQRRLTAIDPYASLLRAAPRPAGSIQPSLVPLRAGRPEGGVLAGRSGGAFARYLVSPVGGAVRTITLAYQPFDAGQAHAIGCTLFRGGVTLGSGSGQATGLGDPINSSSITLPVPATAAAEPLLLQVFNYSNAAVTYTVDAA